ncbi:MAG: exosome complex RNA-binding protein Rrp4 [Thermoplasmata archaeon]
MAGDGNGRMGRGGGVGERRTRREEMKTRTWGKEVMGRSGRGGEGTKESHITEVGMRPVEELWRGRGRRGRGEGGTQAPPAVQREIVLPGERLGAGRLRAGPGTYREGDAVFAATLGIKTMKQGEISVIPLAGKYLPKPGDIVVGKVVEMTPTAWVIDLNSPYVAPLPASETPWEVEYGETPKYLSIGDTVLLQVRSVDEMKKVSVTMKGPGLRRLTGGQTIDIEAPKVPRVIGKGGSMINLLKRLTRCRILVGQNGRIWLDGTVDDIDIAMAAIRRIECESHRLGLTDAVASLIGEMRRSLEEARRQAAPAGGLNEVGVGSPGEGGGGGCGGREESRGESRDGAGGGSNF